MLEIGQLIQQLSIIQQEDILKHIRVNNRNLCWQRRHPLGEDLRAENLIKFNQMKME